LVGVSPPYHGPLHFIPLRWVILVFNHLKYLLPRPCLIRFRKKILTSIFYLFRNLLTRAQIFITPSLFETGILNPVCKHYAATTFLRIRIRQPKPIKIY
jgi:hypothetical protein